MKIVQVNILNETGSTGKIVQGISKVCIKHNIEVYTAYGYGISKKDNSYKIGSKLEYCLHNILSRLFCNQGRYSMIATYKFVNYLKKIRPDIIHLHNIHGNYLNYKILFKYITKNNIPVVWTFHDCWTFTGKCVHFDYISCDKWKDECHNCSILNEYPMSLFLDGSRKEFRSKMKMFSNVKKLIIVTPSEWMANKVKESFFKKKKVLVINNGINLTNFNDKENNLRKLYNLDDKKVILGVASSWTQKKGLDDFNRLSLIISEEYQIVLIGIDKKNQIKMCKNIKCVEKTENAEMLACWYSLSSVFVNLTYEDTFPTVNIESLACNTPVITYDTGGSPEILDEQSGFICEKGNINDVWDKIQEVCKNEEKFENTRNRILNMYDEDKQFEKYIDIYHTIMNGGANDIYN